LCRPLALVVALAGAKEPPGKPDQPDHGDGRGEEDHDLDEPVAAGEEHGWIVRRLYTGGVATKEQVLEILRTVEDPELGMDIVDLGLLYEVEVEDSTAKITYSLTSMGCPAGPLIAGDIDSAARQVEGIDNVELELTFDPPWTPDKMSDDAKFILGFG
jgi:metal-sulfur cluster biosynthetic enzyme